MTQGIPGSTPPCIEDGCPELGVARRLCLPHYRIHYRLGTLPPKQVLRTVDERFWPKVNKTGPLSLLLPPHDPVCWEWIAGTTSAGYGTFRLDGRSLGAHLVAWTLTGHGPVPDGLELDHLCHNADPDCLGGVTCPHRRCVNPDHIEPVPTGENVRRSLVARAGINARKTHCINGHPFSGENLKVDINGRRSCRACSKIYMAAYRERNPR